MKKFLVICLLLLSGCSTSNVDVVEEKLKVGATIFPIYDIVREIGGDRIDLVQLVPTGVSPHTFELTPSLAAAFEDRDLVFAVGHELDGYATDLADNGVVVTVDRGIDLLAFEDEHEDAHEDEHVHGEFDPHYWLSSYNGKVIAKNVMEDLSALDPENAEFYLENLKAYQAEIDLSADKWKKLFEDSENEANLIVFHDAWAYFARDFGLKIVGHFENEPGKEPTAKELAELHDLAKEYQVKTVFSEPQLSPDLIKPFVDDLGLKLEVLDPLGGLEGRESYLKMLEYNVMTVYEALRTQ